MPINFRGSSNSALLDSANIFTNTNTFNADVRFKSGIPYADVRAYGAVGDGVNDDRPAIQAAIDAVASAGFGEVYLPRGVYRVTINTTNDNALQIPGRIMLRGSGRAVSIIQLANSQPGTNTTSILQNTNKSGGGDQNIVLSDFSIDGNCANQTNIQNGISLWRTRGCRLNRISVQDCRGTGSSPPNETFQIQFLLGLDNTANSCTVAGTGVGSVATGFANLGSVGTRLTDCEAWGLTIGHGFAHNACTDIVYSTCRSYLNGNGFNHEVSDGVIFNACIAGGVVIEGTGSPWPYAAGTTLGNSAVGFLLNGTDGGDDTGGKNRGPILNACISDRNQTPLLITDATNLTYARIIGGCYSNPTGSYHVVFQSNADDTTTFETMPSWGDNSQALIAASAAGYAAYNVPSVLTGFPAVPASGVTLNLHYPFPVKIYVSGGTSMTTYLNGSGTAAGTTGELFVIRPHGSIGHLYASAPTYQAWID